MEDFHHNFKYQPIPIHQAHRIRSLRYRIWY